LQGSWAINERVLVSNAAFAKVSIPNRLVGPAPGPAPRPLFTRPPAMLRLATRKPDLLLWLLAALLFMNVWRIQDVIPALGKLKLPMLTLLITLVVFMADSKRTYLLQRLKSPIPALIFGTLIVILIGLPFSLWRGKGVTFLTSDYIPLLLLAGMLVAAIRSYADLEWIVLINLLGAMFYAGMCAVNFQVDSSGRLANLYFYDANDFALLLVSSFPFAVYCLRPGTSIKLKILGFLAMVLFIFMLIKSGSRGGFISFVVVMSYLLICFRALKLHYRLGAVIAGLALLITFASEQYWKTMSTILHPEQDYNMKDDVGRMEIWKRGFSYMEARPIVGVGVRAFPQAEGTLSKIAKEYAARGKGLKWSVAHNAYVEVGAELGVPGLVLFVSTQIVALLTCLGIARRADRKSPRQRIIDNSTPAPAALAHALIAAIIGYMTAAFFLSAEYFALYYVLLATIVGLAALERRFLMAKRPQRRRRPQFPRGTPPPQRALPRPA
jgi:O-antigen ligase